MVQINQLSSVDVLAAGDQLVIFDTSNGDARKASINLLLSYMQANLTFPADTAGQYTTQRAAPSSSGFTVAMTNDGTNIHLILTPTAGFAAGTITLPALADLVDKQELLVNCTQQVTTLIITPAAGTNVTGEPASLAADDFFRLKFDLGTAVWYRVG